MIDHQALRHSLRISVATTTDSLATCLGGDRNDVDVALREMAVGGLVDERESIVGTSWRLTEQGRQLHRTELGEEMAHDARDRLGTTYAEFSVVNSEIKQVCTDWQLRGPTTVNTHDDPAYDASVIERLTVIHHRATSLLGDMSTVVPALAGYSPRLAAALDRLNAGDRDAFTRPLAASYHDVWMELHQDLMLRLDLERTDADA